MGKRKTRITYFIYIYTHICVKGTIRGHHAARTSRVGDKQEMPRQSSKSTLRQTTSPHARIIYEILCRNYYTGL